MSKQTKTPDAPPLERTVIRAPISFRGHMMRKYQVNELIALLNSEDARVPGSRIRLRFSLDYGGVGSQFFTVHVEEESEGR